MTFIHRVRFIHREFKELCNEDKLDIDALFWKQSIMEIRYPIDEESVKQKNYKGSDAFKVVDSYFQLGFKTRQKLANPHPRKLPARTPGASPLLPLRHGPRRGP